MVTCNAKMDIFSKDKKYVASLLPQELKKKPTKTPNKTIKKQ